MGKQPARDGNIISHHNMSNYSIQFDDIRKHR